VLKQMLELVISRQATLGLAAHAVLLLIPYVLAFSLPMGMLTAALLVFGRLSADQELTAARASGISLASLVAPVLGLSVVVSAVCAVLNFHIAPASRVAYLELLRSASIKDPTRLLESDRYSTFGRYTVFARKVHSDGTNLDDVNIMEWDTNNAEVFWCQAPTAQVEFGKTNITVYLQDAATATHDTNGWQAGIYGPFSLPPVPYPRAADPLVVSISDMTFPQLREKLEWLERGADAVLPRGASREELVKERDKMRKTTEEMAMPLLVYMNQEVAFSFACIGFTLVGIPLAIRAHRRETSVGIAAALLLVLVYYSFMVLAQAWENHPDRYPCLIVWLPDFLFQAAGGVMLWRVNKKVG
jgi:lipopolysaccharide export system permease protein